MKQIKQIARILLFCWLRIASSSKEAVENVTEQSNHLTDLSRSGMCGSWQYLNSVGKCTNCSVFSIDENYIQHSACTLQDNTVCFPLSTAFNSNHFVEVSIELSCATEIFEQQTLNLRRNFSKSCSQNIVTSCKECTACGKDEHEVSPCTATSDRKCVPLQACRADQYRNIVLNMSCSRLPRIATGQRDIGACAAVMEARCKDCTVCRENEYEISPCTATSDRKCVSLQACRADQYRNVVLNMSCSRLPRIATGQRDIGACTSVMEARCKDCTVCRENAYEISPCTATTDRKCVSLRTCRPNQYRNVVLGLNCSNAPRIATGQRDIGACAAMLEARCKDCTACRENEYEISPCTAMSDRKCVSLQACQPNQYRSVVLNMSCSNVQRVVAGQRDIGACTAVMEPECKDCTVCRENEYEVSPCTATSDRKCVALQACRAGQHRNVVLNMSCSQLSRIVPGERDIGNCEAFVSAACVGSILCEACPAAHFMVSNCSNSTQPTCSRCSPCNPGYYRKLPCNNATDTICEVCTVCRAGHFAQTSCTILADTVCHPCSSCPAGKYTASACLNADVICEPCLICGTGQINTRTCQVDANAQCETAVPVVLSFTVTMPMVLNAFREVSDGYVIAVGEVSFKNTLPSSFSALSNRQKSAYFNSSVKIKSVLENLNTRRHLLAASVAVSTQVSMLGQANAAAAAAGLQSNLSAALIRNGLPPLSIMSSISVAQQEPGATNISVVPAQPIVNQTDNLVHESDNKLAFGLGLGLGLGIPVLAAVFCLIHYIASNPSRKTKSSFRPALPAEQDSANPLRPESTSQASLTFLDEPIQGISRQTAR